MAVTTVARTLLDLAAVVNRRQVERAVREAEFLRIFDGAPWRSCSPGSQGGREGRC